jgi:cytochrome P450
VPIPKDAAVSLSIPWQRDETIFEDPNKFDIRRSARAGLGFGTGVHTCVGMPAARMEIELLNFLLDLPGLHFDPTSPEPKIRGLQSRCPAELHLV